MDDFSDDEDHAPGRGASNPNKQTDEFGDLSDEDVPYWVTELRKERRTGIPARSSYERKPTNIADPNYGADFHLEYDRQGDHNIQALRRSLKERAARSQALTKERLAPKPGVKTQNAKGEGDTPQPVAELLETTPVTPRAAPANSRRAALKVYGRAMARCESVFEELLDYAARANDLTDKFTALELTNGAAQGLASLGRAFNQLCLANSHTLRIERGVALEAEEMP